MRVESPENAERVSTPTGGSWMWLSPRFLAALFLVWLLSRLVFDSMWNLVPDEAYYWVWSRHLALSYLDHPPMVAYLIRLGTALLDNTEFGVRWLSAVATAGTVLVLTMAARRITADVRTASFVPMALLLCPMVAVVGTIATPDAPACFFQAAALAVAMRIFEGQNGSEGLKTPYRTSYSAGGGKTAQWAMFGAFMGLALDSKYTSVLLGVAVLGAMMSCAEGRRRLLSPGPWVGAIVAIVVFSPVIYWNAEHDWASFGFQLHHGTTGGGSPAWKNLADYLGSQFAVCTPVLFGVCVWVLVSFWRRRDNAMPVRILLWAATTPLVFFAVSAVRRRVEGNWPMFAYFPAIVLVARFLGEGGRRARIVWAEAAVTVTLVMNVILHSPLLVWKEWPNLGAPQWDHLFGWSTLAKTGVDPERLDSPVIAADYEYASELCFYLPDKPDIRPLSDPTRPTAFDFFGGSSDTLKQDRIVLVRRIPKGYDAPPKFEPFGDQYDYTMLDNFDQYVDRRQIRRSLIEVAQRRGVQTRGADTRNSP